MAGCAKFLLVLLMAFVALIVVMARVGRRMGPPPAKAPVQVETPKEAIDGVGLIGKSVVAVEKVLGQPSNKSKVDRADDVVEDIRLYFLPRYRVTATYKDGALLHIMLGFDENPVAGPPEAALAYLKLSTADLTQVSDTGIVTRWEHRAQLPALNVTAVRAALDGPFATVAVGYDP